MVAVRGHSVLYKPFGECWYLPLYGLVGYPADVSYARGIGEGIYRANACPLAHRVGSKDAMIGTFTEQSNAPRDGGDCRSGMDGAAAVALSDDLPFDSG